MFRSLLAGAPRLVDLQRAAESSHETPIAALRAYAGARHRGVPGPQMTARKRMLPALAATASARSCSAIFSRRQSMSEADLDSFLYGDRPPQGSCAPPSAVANTPQPRRPPHPRP